MSALEPCRRQAVDSRSRHISLRARTSSIGNEFDVERVQLTRQIVVGVLPTVRRELLIETAQLGRAVAHVVQDAGISRSFAGDDDFRSNRAVEPTFGNKRERRTTVAEDREVETGVHALSELVCRKVEEVDDGKAKRPGSILRSLGKNKNEEILCRGESVQRVPVEALSAIRLS